MSEKFKRINRNFSSTINAYWDTLDDCHCEEREKWIREIAVELDPDCPDIGAYVDGHCSIVELVKRKLMKG